MNILILTSERENTELSTEIRLRDELIRRGNEVSLMDIAKLKKQSSCSANTSAQKCSRLKRFFSNAGEREANATALQSILQAGQYDAILPTKICAAEAVSSMFQFQYSVEAFTALVSTEYDSLPRRANLYCDEYIVTSKRAIPLMIDWGIPVERIHLVDVSEHTIQTLCDLLEPLIKQWIDMTKELRSIQMV